MQVLPWQTAVLSVVGVQQVLWHLGRCAGLTVMHEMKPQSSSLAWQQAICNKNMDLKINSDHVKFQLNMYLNGKKYIIEQKNGWMNHDLCVFLFSEDVYLWISHVKSPPSRHISSLSSLQLRHQIQAMENSGDDCDIHKRVVTQHFCHQCYYQTTEPHQSIPSVVSFKDQNPWFKEFGHFCMQVLKSYIKEKRI